jgi:hypothetical protein
MSLRNLDGIFSHFLLTTLLSGIEIGNFTFLKFQIQEK